MKKIKFICMLIVSIMIGASAVASISAEEIEEGSLDITVNDGLWGTISPSINIPDETSITLEAIKVNDTNYEVKDNLSIPLTITCDKPNVLTPKFVYTVVRARRGIGDVKIQFNGVVPVYNGTIIYDGIVPDMITANARYNISGETFSEGEKMTLMVLAVGLPPGEGNPNEVEYTLDEVLDLIPKNLQLFNGIFIRLLKEFVEAGVGIDLSSFPVIAGKSIDLNIDYALGGEEEPPEGYTLDVDVAEGNGSVTISPAQDLYDEEELVELTAVPNAGYIFSEWTGDISSTDNPVNVTMDSNKTISAHFIEEPVLIETKGGFGSVKLTLTNQRDYELSDIEYNITMEGGLLGKISGQVNGTIENITADGNIVLNTPQVWLGLGKSTINLELIIPGEGVIEKTYSATHIGPLILA
jgi:hypothetical protein